MKDSNYSVKDTAARAAANVIVFAGVGMIGWFLLFGASHLMALLGVM